MAMSEFNYATLPVVPAMQADEWFESYLVRLAQANGREKPTERDVGILRTQVASAEQIEGSHLRGYLPTVPVWAKKKLGSVIRYCPACFQERRYVRSRWRLKSVDVCTIHDLNIKRGCIEPALSQVVNHRNPIYLTDLNIEQIWDGASCPIPDARQHARNIWHEFELALENGDQRGSNTRLGWALIAEHLLDAAVTAELGFEVPLRGESRIYHRTRWLRANKVELHASKDSVLRFLLSIKVNNQRRAVASRLSEIIKQPEQGSMLFADLPLQYLYDRLIAAAPETNTHISYGVLPADLHPPGYVSVNCAEGMLGKRTAFVQYLVRANFFQRLHHVKFGRRLYIFIHKDEVEGCRRWLSECMTPEEAMQTLNIDRPFYFALQRNGLLQPINIGSWSFIRKDDIAALTNKLDSIAQPYSPERSQILPLCGPWIRRHHTVLVAYDTLVKEIWQGRYAIFRKLDEPGLRAYYVGADAAMRACQLRSESAVRQNISKREEQQLLFQELQ
jgi:hypothetical protein